MAEAQEAVAKEYTHEQAVALVGRINKKLLAMLAGAPAYCAMIALVQTAVTVKNRLGLDDRKFYMVIDDAVRGTEKRVLDG